MPKAKSKRSGSSCLRLSGVTNGIAYRFGVANPFNGRRNLAPLNACHLPALRALLRFVDPVQPERRFAISEAEFKRCLPDENAWSLLVDFLTCWVRTRTGSTTIVSHFATVSFCKRAERMTAFVILSEYILPVLKQEINLAPQ